MDTLPISQVKNAFGIPFRSPSAIPDPHPVRIEQAEGKLESGGAMSASIGYRFESAKKSSTLSVAWRMKDLLLPENK